jgi:hypothetical protein
MIILATLHNNNYQELATETWDNNKIKYAEKHGYAYLSKTDDFYGFEPGFEKIQFLLDTFEAYPEATWIWWTGTDSMVTNFNTKVEDKIAEAGDAHVIMSADFNFKINCDSILIKNTIEAKAWLEDIMEAMPKYASHQFKEQQYMLDSLDKNADIIKLMPQNFMNSYEYKMYKVAPWLYEKETDVNGDRGQWEAGDWLVHWPGTQHRERMVLVQETKEKIIY